MRRGGGLIAVDSEVKLTEIAVSPSFLVTIYNFPPGNPASTSRRRTLQLSTAVGTSEIRATKYSARGSAFTTLNLGSGRVEEVPTAGFIAAGWPGWATAFSMTAFSMQCLQ